MKWQKKPCTTLDGLKPIRPIEIKSNKCCSKHIETSPSIIQSDRTTEQQYAKGSWPMKLCDRERRKNGGTTHERQDKNDRKKKTTLNRIPTCRADNNLYDRKHKETMQ